MKLHHIHKDFKGTQDGQHDYREFKAGEIAPLSPGLAAIVVREGWAEPHTPDVLSGGPHPKLDVEPDAPNVHVESMADHRETKVTGPEETKPLAEMKHKDL